MEQDHFFNDTGLENFGPGSEQLAAALKTVAGERNYKVLEAGYALIQTADGETLLLRRSEKGCKPGLWEFPGGKKEPDHIDYFDSIRTEVAEETGLVLVVNPELYAGDGSEFDKRLLRRKIDLLKSLGNRVIESILPPRMVGFRFSTDKNKEGQDRLYLAYILRYLIRNKVDVCLSDEHSEYKWVNLKDLSSVDWARGFYGEAALRTVSLFPERYEELRFLPDIWLALVHFGHSSGNHHSPGKQSLLIH